ncbi:hypothetical protein AB2S62_21740 [Vibrio sp. NTOU-M3]|uniref:hypothetical protein n=1 Tax=Vibrio sp. NTOU-M3 TaxID=3234954 RepID=UPI00349F1CD9
MDFLDDLLNFGAGALDSVGEHADWLFGNNNQTSNPNVTQQPEHPVVDNNGNTVTTPQGQAQSTDNTLLFMVGGGFLLVIIILLLFMASNKG